MHIGTLFLNRLTMIKPAPLLYKFEDPYTQTSQFSLGYVEVSTSLISPTVPPPPESLENSTKKSIIICALIAKTINDVKLAQFERPLHQSLCSVVLFLNQTELVACSEKTKFRWRVSPAFGQRVSVGEQSIPSTIRKLPHTPGSTVAFSNTLKV